MIIKMEEEYFELCKSHLVENPAPIVGLDTSRYKYRMSAQEFDAIEDVCVAYFAGDEAQELCDLIIEPTLLLSDRMKRVFELYEDKMEFKGVQLYPMSQNCTKYPLYWIPKFCEGDFLHHSTIFYDNGIIQELVLNRKKLGEYSIVRITDSAQYRIIVSLPVVESLLRRRMYGIEIHKVKMA